MSLFNEVSTGAAGMPPMRLSTQPSMADYLKAGNLGFGLPDASQGAQQPSPWAIQQPGQQQPGTMPMAPASPAPSSITSAMPYTGQMPAPMAAGTPAPMIAAPQPVGDQTGAVTSGFTNMAPPVSPMPAPQSLIQQPGTATPFAPSELAAAKPATAAPATSPVAPTGTGDQAQSTSLLNNPWAKLASAKPATLPGMSGVLRSGSFTG